MALAFNGKGGGGGSQAVQSASVTLNNAQIKALPTTARTIVAAPGAGQMILPIEAFLISDFAVAYGGIDASTEYPDIRIRSGMTYLATFIDDPDSWTVPLTALTALLTGTNESGPLFKSVHPDALAFPFSNGRTTLVPDSATRHPAGGDALTISSTNSVDFTGGDAANTLTVTVLYTTLAL